MLMLCNKPGSILCWHTECYIVLIPRYKPETGNLLWLSNPMFILKGISGVEADSLQTKISLKNSIFPSKSYSQAILPEQFCMSSTQYKSCQWVEQAHRTASPMKMTAHCLHWQHSRQQRRSYRNAALASFKGQEQMWWLLIKVSAEKSSSWNSWKKNVNANQRT